MALIGKEDLAHEVADRSGLGIAEARSALEEMFGAIETQLAEGNEVRLTGFGKFSVSRRKAREGRNPQTGEPIQIAAKKVPHFTAGADLKKAVPAASEEGPPRKTKPAAKTTKSEASVSSKTNQAANASGTEETSPEDEEATARSDRKRAKGTRGPKVSRKPTRRNRAAAPGSEAAPDPGGAEEEESDEPGTEGEAVSVASSGAKFALVTAAGLAVGVAGGLALIHIRK